jgi:hypothetical protein
MKLSIVLEPNIMLEAIFNRNFYDYNTELKPGREKNKVPPDFSMAMQAHVNRKLADTMPSLIVYAQIFSDFYGRWLRSMSPLFLRDGGGSGSKSPPTG